MADTSPATSPSDSIRTLAAAGVAAAVGVAVTLAYAYPGLLSVDSLDQLLQGRNGAFTLWHPPVMSWLLGLGDRLVAGTALVLVLHVTGFWASWALLVGLSLRTPWKAGLVVLLGGLFPPVFALLGAVWKDVGMATALLAGAGLLLLAERRRSGVALGFALLALWYASAVRHNAVVAVLPMCLWAGVVLVELMPRRPARQTLVGLSAGLLLCMAIYGSGVAANRALVAQPSPDPLQQILVHDLVAVSVAAGSNELPGFMAEKTRAEDLPALYSPISIVPLYYGAVPPTRLPLVLERAELQQIERRWWEAVRRHPGAYLSHRWAVFRQLLFGRCYVFQDGIEPNALGLTFPPSAFNRWVVRGLRKLEPTFLFDGWPYLALLVLEVAAGFAFRSRGAAGVLAVSWSGFLYVGAYLFAGTSADFRMVWWSVVAGLAVPVLLVGMRGMRGRAQAASGPTG